MTNQAKTLEATFANLFFTDFDWTEKCWPARSLNYARGKRPRLCRGLLCNALSAGSLLRCLLKSDKTLTRYIAIVFHFFLSFFFRLFLDLFSAVSRLRIYNCNISQNLFPLMITKYDYFSEQKSMTKNKKTKNCLLSNKIVENFYLIVYLQFQK